MKLSSLVLLMLIFLIIPHFLALSQELDSTESVSDQEEVFGSLVDRVFKDFSSKAMQKLHFPEQLDASPKLLTNKLAKSLPLLSDRQVQMQPSFKANGANLRVLDKIYGTVVEIKAFKFSELKYDSVNIFVEECFYDFGPLRQEALALVKISNSAEKTDLFDGWMSSRYTHLTNYNSYRYSFWLLSCIISDQE